MDKVPLTDIPVTADVEACAPQYTAGERAEGLYRIKQRLREQDAVLVAHYYSDSDLQMISNRRPEE